ncbi:zinc-binding dehydrogenase [bacterium]|nr:zinc-binding dehydrogenase [bacterium]
MTSVACLRDFGPAETAVRLESWPLAEPGPREALVRVLAAPINPADINLLEGTYGIRPELPTVAGIEGMGEVVAVGDAVTSLTVGQRVIVPVRLGWWCAARILEAGLLIPVPAEVPEPAVAMLTVNPATAWRLLHDFCDLAPGEWVLQNAANSGVGRAVIAIARARGWRTINVVRRPELVAELEAAGADVVLTDTGPVAKQIATRTNGAPIRLALNAVGGDSARQLGRALAPRGILVTYGAMAREPVRIDNGSLIFRDIRVRGFWVSEWYRRMPRPAVRAMFAELFELAMDGQLCPPIAAQYPLEKVSEAIAHARREARGGKIMLKIGHR